MYGQDNYEPDINALRLLLEEITKLNSAIDKVEQTLLHGN